MQLNRTSFQLFIRKYAHALWFIPFGVLNLQFVLLEQVLVPRYWVYSPIDQYIPFLPVFVVPYVLWFVLVAAILIVLFFHDRKDFIRTALLLYAGMGLALVLYMFFPNAQPLRPIITGQDVFSNTVRYSIYANDTNTNCCPSIHVLNQMAVHIGLCKSKLFRNRKGWKIASFIATLLICASTCFIKQHSIVDVSLALLMEIPLYLLVFKVNWKDFFKRIKLQIAPVSAE